MAKNLDPRNGQFTALALSNGGNRPGVWTLQHIGFGEHMFVDAGTGDAVPAASVVVAIRARVDD